MYNDEHEYLIAQFLGVSLTTYLGEIAALGTAISWSFGSIFFTISSRIMGHVNVNRLRLVIGLLLLSLVHVIIFGRLMQPHVTVHHWFWFGLSGIIGFAIGDTLLFRSFVLIGPRLAMLTMALVPIFSTIIAWFFLHEVLDVSDIIAIVLTIVGISWVILGREKIRQEQGQFFTGIICGIGGAFCQALGLILSKKGLENNFSALAANIIRILVATIAIWILTLLRSEVPSTFKELKNRKASIALFGGAFFGPFLGVWLSLVAVQFTYVGIASTLIALPPVILIPLSYWIFKEKITIGSVLGTIVALSGVALIFLL